MAPHVRIFQPAKSAMQSGRGNTGHWVLEYPNTHRRAPDALMGWIGGADTPTQLRLTFATQQEAVRYAEAQGLTYEVEPGTTRKIVAKSYADNFRFGRRENWTH